MLKNSMINPPVLIILAAGKSSRMGTPKGLLKFHSKYWLEEQFLRAKKSNLKSIILVLGFDSELYLRKMPFLQLALNKFVNYNSVNIKVVFNKTPHLGIFSSLLIGLNEVDKRPEVLILPIDVPLCDHESILSLIKIKKTIVIPQYKGKNGHPVKLSYDFWSRIKDMDVNNKDSRLDYLIKKIKISEISIVKTWDSNGILNINTPQEWNNFIASKK